MSDNKVTTDSYKGVRDFYPRDQFVHRHILDTMSRACESFGFEEYGASILEHAELYKSKTSDEIVNEQTYTFTDRGEREVTLRPEMTPTVARLVAAKKRELVMPVRWYSIPNVFRYEKPQRGRLREHWQLNADIFGVTNADAEIEILMLAHHIMTSFGADESMFTIRINDRALLESVFDEHDIDADTRKSLMQLLDRQNKIKTFDEDLATLLGDKADAMRDSLSRLSSGSTLEMLISRLSELGINNVVVDTSIVRGFDYNTGLVFEVFDESPDNNRSLFGGGRYDNLMDLFDAEQVPAVGFGMGDVTMHDFLETHSLTPAYAHPANVVLATITPDAIDYAFEIARELRESDISVTIDYSDKKIGDKLERAHKRGVSLAIALGPDEVENQEFTVKVLETREEANVARRELAEEIFTLGI